MMTRVNHIIKQTLLAVRTFRLESLNFGQSHRLESNSPDSSHFLVTLMSIEICCFWSKKRYWLEFISGNSSHWPEPTEVGSSDLFTMKNIVTLDRLELMGPSSSHRLELHYIGSSQYSKIEILSLLKKSSSGISTLLCIYICSIIKTNRELTFSPFLMMTTLVNTISMFFKRFLLIRKPCFIFQKA